MGHPMSDTEVHGPPGDVAKSKPPVTEHAVVQKGRSSGRAVLVMAPLVVGLVIAAAVGARLLLADIPDRSATEAPAEVPCWDRVTRLEKDCGSPTGRQGLRWMFPSFKPADPRCRDVLPDFPKSSRPAMFECRVDVPSGSATITYSQLTTVERGRGYLEKVFGSPPKELDDALGRRLLWTEGDDPGNRVYALAVMYAELPFAVEVRARSAEARDEALDRLVRFRPEKDASVRPLGEGRTPSP